MVGSRFELDAPVGHSWLEVNVDRYGDDGDIRLTGG